MEEIFLWEYRFRLSECNLGFEIVEGQLSASFTMISSHSVTIYGDANFFTFQHQMVFRLLLNTHLHPDCVKNQMHDYGKENEAILIHSYPLHSEKISLPARSMIELLVVVYR